MNTKKYTWLFYFITATIVATIGVQFYWNYKNYEENKQRIKNEIQLSLDNAIEEYYASLAKNKFITIVNSSFSDTPLKLVDDNSSDTIKKIKSRITLNNVRITSDETFSKEKIDSIMNNTKNFVENFNEKRKYKELKIDSASAVTQFLNDKTGIHINKDGSSSSVSYFKGKAAADSLRFVSDIKPIFISFINQSLNYVKIDSLIQMQLNSKGINVTNNFVHLKNDTIYKKAKDSLLVVLPNITTSKSTYAKENETFKLQYENPSFEALKRSSLGIFLSFLLSLLIISCLFYLLKIINQQKELSLIKNDLISNITHEFKTPIATVATAIEAIENFNVIDDKEKTQKYLSLSSIQLKKLHQMVEKLLETATLDSEQLLLKKETIDVTEVIQKIVAKHQLLTKEKSIHFSTNLKPVYIKADAFHFENVVSNLIDNAIKYGGDTIEVTVHAVLNNTEITVADNGTGIEKNQQEKIFDKFYRIPKGNTHDVKGFGIGLYYCKKIINKHEGTLQLNSDKKETIFKINIPNG